MIRNDLELIELNMENIQIARELTEEFVGKGLYTDSDFLHIVSDPDSFFYLFKIEEEMKGYFYCFLCEAKDAMEKTGLKIDIWNSFSPDVKLGVCKSIGISENIRGNGISDDLLNYFTKLLLDAGAEKIFIPAWVKDGFIPAEKLLKRCGFHYYGLAIRPWYDLETLECPHCETSKCTCDAAIFYKNEEEFAV